jgi:hypothetical protein
MSNVLTKEEVRGILSRNIYWKEVYQREVKEDILKMELVHVLQDIGIEKTLKAIAEYAIAEYAKHV